MPEELRIVVIKPEPLRVIIREVNTKTVVVHEDAKRVIIRAPGPKGLQGLQGVQGIQGIQGIEGDDRVFIGPDEPLHPPYDLWVKDSVDLPELWVFV